MGDALMIAELRRLCDVWEAAQEAVRVARAAGEHDRPALLAASEALADWHAASASVADTLLFMLRHAARHRADALRAALVDLLRPELEPLADEVVKLRRGRR